MGVPDLLLKGIKGVAEVPAGVGKGAKMAGRWAKRQAAGMTPEQMARGGKSVDGWNRLNDSFAISDQVADEQGYEKRSAPGLFEGMGAPAMVDTLVDGALFVGSFLHPAAMVAQLGKMGVEAFASLLDDVFGDDEDPIDYSGMAADGILANHAELSGGTFSGDGYDSGGWNDQEHGSANPLDMDGNELFPATPQGEDDLAWMSDQQLLGEYAAAEQGREADGFAALQKALDRNEAERMAQWEASRRPATPPAPPATPAAATTPAGPQPVQELPGMVPYPFASGGQVGTLPSATPMPMGQSGGSASAEVYSDGLSLGGLFEGGWKAVQGAFSAIGEGVREMAGIFQGQTGDLYQDQYGQLSVFDDPLQTQEGLADHYHASVPESSPSRYAGFKRGKPIGQSPYEPPMDMDKYQGRLRNAVRHQGGG